MGSVEINFVATIVSAVIVFILGAFWYSPLLFSKKWMKANNVSQKEMDKARKQGMTKEFITQFIITLVTAFVLSMFVDYVGVTTFAGGLFVGFMAWLGFIATSFLGQMLWIKKPMVLYYIDAGHYLVSYAIMAGIIAVW